ncbi:amino acid permease [Citrobacter telavivensis]
MVIKCAQSLIGKNKIPFTSYDFGWVVLCIGMAIGAGIVYMPIQVGVKGLWVFVFAIALSYPAIHYLQDLYLKTLTQTEECDDYANIISQYLGKNWGIILGIAYFLMLLTGILNYSTGIVNDSATYLQSYHLTTGNLSDELWYGLVILVIMVLIANQGEKFLFKISGPMIIFKLIVIVFLGVIMIPYWKLSNISGFTEILPFLRDVLLTLPFTLFSILFVQILNPMNIAYRKVEKDPVIASYRAIRASRLAYVILAIAVLFFAFSFSFAITKDEATSALNQNISALALASQIIPGYLVNIMSVLLNIFAIMTAFFSLYLGLKESVQGLVMNILTRIYDKDSLNINLITLSTISGIIIFLWGWVTFDFSVMLLMQLSMPVFGLVTCFVPFYLVYKVDSLANLRSPSNYYVAFYGVLISISPFLKFFE